MTENQIKNHIRKSFKNLTNTELLGILYFGSRVRQEVSEDSDYDIGIIYRGKTPHFEVPENWDLFLWSEKKWLKGFALQVEIARYAKILYDPKRIIRKQFKMIHEKILPHWLTYIKKF
ncbi:MAG: nucleotidyltransferase domain-containing protein [Leptospiraceae bacterium]|nr:nucleotidyltransferase domain-containing protein [Leptospiraceae bacterium]MDW7976086.1 nucleotidyltransferase domain-containing protein [Leptospiraceae bacterium]